MYPSYTKGHTYACIYTVGRRPPLSPSECHYEFTRFQLIRRKRQANVFDFMIGQAPDFRLAGNSLPAIRGKTGQR